MDAVIDEAIQGDKEQREPPQKKRRVEHQPIEKLPQQQEEKEEGGVFSMFSGGSTDGLRKDLKRLIIKNPDLDFQQHREIDAYIETLDDEQLKATLENARFQLGLLNPNGNGVSFLGIIGDLSDRIFGTKGLSRRLIEDKELVEMMEAVVPSDMTWLSQPFRIINKILYHIQFGEEK